MDLRDYLLVGSYLFGSGVLTFAWREVRGVKTVLEDIRRDLARQAGREEGADLRRRVENLERNFVVER